MNQKKLIRQTFRTEVFKRDKYTCRKCGHEFGQFCPHTLDAHHITDRNEIINGGYVKENGISLCSECHEIAELYHQIGITEAGFHPDDLYVIIGSSKELAIKKSEEL